MSRNFAEIPAVPFIGQPYAQSIATCTPRDGKPRTVKIAIDWSLYGVTGETKEMGVSVNLLGQAVETPLDKIRSVYIDNTFSPSPIFVFFPDTQFTLVAPAGAVVCAPVFTNVQNALIFAQDFITGQIPKTTVHFSNVHLEGFFIPTIQGGGGGDNGGGYTPNPLEFNYRGNAGFNTGGKKNLLTKAGFNIGDAADERIIVVAYAATDTTGTFLFEEVKFNGLDMVREQEHRGFFGPGLGGRFVGCGIAYLNVAAGVDGTVLIKTNYAMETMFAAVYTITGNKELTPFASMLHSAGVGTGNTINMSRNSAGIFGGAGYRGNFGSPDPMIWQNVSKDGQIGYQSSASLLEDTGNAITVNATYAEIITGIAFK